jgi:hypothetical protein
LGEHWYLRQGDEGIRTQRSEFGVARQFKQSMTPYRSG